MTRLRDHLSFAGAACQLPVHLELCPLTRRPDEVITVGGPGKCFHITTAGREPRAGSASDVVNVNAKDAATRIASRNRDPFLIRRQARAQESTNRPDSLELFAGPIEPGKLPVLKIGRRIE